MLEFLYTDPICAQTINPAASNSGSAVDNVPSVGHISCDALKYNSGASTLKVFAWDKVNGSNQSWAWDNGSGMNFEQNQLGTDVNHQEIELVSINDGQYIYAILAYEDPNNKVSWEAYEWQFPGWSLVFGGAVDFTTTATGFNVTSVGGDHYGHFIVTADEGVSPGDVIYYYAGYINSSTGNLVKYDEGRITYGTEEIYKADVDITYDSYSSAPDDAWVFLTCVYKDDYTILAAGKSMGNLIAGVDWDIFADNSTIGEIGNECEVDHPSISVSDGYLGTPHAAVVYAEECEAQRIYIFPVDKSSSTTSATIVNVTPLVGVLNKEPEVIVEPAEVAAVVAWNCDDNLTSMISPFIKEGLAHAAQFDNINFLYDITPTDDMQVQLVGGATLLTTVSEFDDDELLYFYYDEGTDDLEYKIESYGATGLRNSGDKKNSSEVFHDLLNDKIVVQSAEINEMKLIALSGAEIMNLKGSAAQIESILNSIWKDIKAGMYLIQFSNQSEQQTSLKIFKQ